MHTSKQQSQLLKTTQMLIWEENAAGVSQPYDLYKCISVYIYDCAIMRISRMFIQEISHHRKSEDERYMISLNKGGTLKYN